MAGNSNTEKPLLILFDYDGTIGTLAEGQVPNTEDGKRHYCFNEELIQLGALAQKNGGLCLGFTNWFSENYSSNGFINYDNSPGRVRLTEGCKSRGLQFNQVIVTHSFLYAYEKLKLNANTKNMPIQDYINQLTLNERLDIIGGYYKDVIEKTEKENQYDKGEKGSKKTHDSVYKEIKQEEQRLIQTYSDEAKEFGLGDPLHLLKKEKLSPGEHGMDKFQMIDVVRLLLPEFKIVVFDDKVEVKKTCSLTNEIDGLDITGQTVLIKKPKVGEELKPLEANAKEWYVALELPESAQNVCLNNAKDFTEKTNHLQKLTDDTIQKVNNIALKIPGLVWKSKNENELIQALNYYSTALDHVNGFSGTASCQSMVLATENLLTQLNQHKDMFKEKTKMSDYEFNQFKDMINSVAIKQIKTNPIHLDLPKESKIKLLTTLDMRKNYAELAKNFSIFESSNGKIENLSKISETTENKSLKQLILNNINSMGHEDKQAVQQYVNQYDPNIFDTNNNNSNKNWNNPQCKEMLSNLNKVTAIINSYGKNGGKSYESADEMAIAARAMSNMYDDLLQKEGCTPDFSKILTSKKMQLLGKVEEFESAKFKLSK